VAFVEVGEQLMGSAMPFWISIVLSHDDATLSLHSVNEYSSQ
jgi:hypothetical protein